MTKKNYFSFSSNCYQSLTPGKCLTRAHFHVAGGITCPTAYILDPRVKGHPKKIFSKLKEINKKIFFFSKKLLPNRILCCSDRVESSCIGRPQISTSTRKFFFRKKLDVRQVRSIFTFAHSK